MYKDISPFGINIDASTIGEAWVDLVDAILEHGKKSLDEDRGRLALQNVRLRISDVSLPDKIIEKYGDKENIDAILHLTLKGDEMYDFDVVPSFSPGAKSYNARIKEGRMIEFVVKRLSNIPESKKAIISFIHWDDYKAVLDTPFDDYLPCITTVQFRLLEDKDGLKMNVNFTARSIDAFQKANGNIIAIVALAQEGCGQLMTSLDKKIEINAIDGFITDAHVYGECLEGAKAVVAKVRSEI